MKTHDKVREPLFHIVKRDGLVWWRGWIVRIVAVVIALLFSGLVTYLLTGENPIEVYKTMWDGAFGTPRRFWNLMQALAMLLCVSLAVTPAFKMRFWNIGAEGQALIGGFAAAAVMIWLPKAIEKFPQLQALPQGALNGIMLTLMVLAAMVVGAIWALIPALFKAKWGTNETLFTLMMNYIATQIVAYFVYIWAGSAGSGVIGVINEKTHLGWMPEFGGTDAAWMPVLEGKLKGWLPFFSGGNFVGQKYLLGILLVLLLTVLMFVYLKFSKHGYEISVVGESENTARYIGINVKKVIIRTMLISGALCGVAGFLLVSGADHSITPDTIDGRGFTAIMVSWLAKFNPITMLLTSFIVVFFEKGATNVATDLGLNHAFSDIITGIIIFFIIGSEFFINYRIKFREKEVKAK